MTSKNFVLYRDAGARWLFLGQLLSQVFDRVTSLGLVWLLTQQFSVTGTSWFLMVGGLPHIFLSWHSGRLINKWGLRRTVIIADFARAALYSIAALTIQFGGNFATLLPFFILTLLSNIAAGFFNPAIMSLPPAVVPENRVQGLTALLTSCGSVAMVLGPLVAVLLIPTVGLPGIFAVTSVAYAVAGFASLQVKAAILPAEENPGSHAIAILRRYGLIAFLLLSFLAMNLLVAPLQVIFPYYAKEVYHRSLDGLAWLESCLGIGLVVGGILLSAIASPKAPAKAISFSLILCALCFLIFALSSDFIVGRMSMVGFGFWLSVANVMIVTLFQKHPSASDVPGVMALVNLISFAAVPVSLGMTGLLLSCVDVGQVAVGAASLLILVTVVTAIRLRKVIS